MVLFKAEEIAEGNGYSIPSRCVEIVFFAGREYISQAVVVTGLKDYGMTAFYYQFQAGASTYTVVKSVGDIH